eukprot:gene17537-19287_t
MSVVVMMRLIMGTKQNEALRISVKILYCVSLRRDYHRNLCYSLYRVLWGPLADTEKLVADYMKNPVGDMISVKCDPYHYKDKWIIKGDAAHAMVPFYGQGMNCGFQDCHVFSDILEKNNFDFGKTLPEYSQTRNPDAEAICDLAMYNYIEMREHVNSKFFILRKKLDNFLQWLFPRHWIPLYSMVTFTTIPYKEVVDRRKQQDKVLEKAFWFLVTLSGLGLCSVVAYKRGFVTLPSFEAPKIAFCSVLLMLLMSAVRISSAEERFMLSGFFTRVELKDANESNNVIDEVPAGNDLMCALHCLGMNECNFFIHHEDTNTCDLLESFDEQELSYGHDIYKKIDY